MDFLVFSFVVTVIAENPPQVVRPTATSLRGGSLAPVPGDLALPGLPLEFPPDSPPGTSPAGPPL